MSIGVAHKYEDEDRGDGDGDNVTLTEKKLTMYKPKKAYTWAKN